jgi:transporter family protein
MIMAFIILKEALTIKTIIGGILISVGTFVLIL